MIPFWIVLQLGWQSYYWLWCDVFILTIENLVMFYRLVLNENVTYFYITSPYIIVFHQYF